MAARSARNSGTMPVIGLLDQRSPEELADRLRGFRQGLKDAGFVEGENVAIEYRWAENQIDRLPALAVELVRRGVKVIASTGGIPAAFVAKAATTTIPVVFLVSDDPVKLDQASSPTPSRQRCPPRGYLAAFCSSPAERGCAWPRPSTTH